ncbi:hypothetical protein [Streptomyces sp. NEAU-S7GS2]|uniref:hypothetical protein n=1 Tax=Streptomyces sp. NEAU-S7GS2 TaxID=2202000 RepID=UPI000D6F4D46|nr:hypothetical protein [Streptomyces sp. NEAU-S7GS2]AWN32625.1 hypothetical protein DKG71_42365 [Streptomyces sp. NEAU-S7GS2]
MANHRRPGFPHRVTLDLTADQFSALTDGTDATGGSMADYLRALIELHRSDETLAHRTQDQLRIVRANRRRTRRAQHQETAA